MIDGIKTDERGSFVWRNENGNVHRLNNLPAVIWKDGDKCYCINGMNHRTNGPAVIRINGKKEYYINNILQEHSEKYTLWICNKAETT